MAKNRYNLAALRQHKADEGVDVIELEVEDKVFRIPAPGFFPDEAHIALKNKDSIELAKSLLGTDYDAYKEAGGKVDDIGLVLEAWGVDQGVDFPKS